MNFSIIATISSPEAVYRKVYRVTRAQPAASLTGFMTSPFGLIGRYGFRVTDVQLVDRVS